MSKTFYIFAVLALCIANHVRADDILPPLITASGSGEVDVDPTEALVSIGIEQHNANLTALRQQVDKSASDIIAFLKDNGVEAKYIQTSYITVSPHYPDQSTSGDTNPDYYIAQKSMTYLLKNLSNYDNIMSGLYDRGLNTVDGITFKVANDTQPQIDAKAKAVANAQDTAQAMADQLGVELGNVYSVTDNGGSGPIPLAQSFAMEADLGSSGPSVSGGQIQYTSTVQVAFYIIQ